MFTILDYSSALEYSIIRRNTNIVYYYIMIIMISSVCIILHKSIFVLSLLHIFYNLPLNYYQQLIVIALLLNLNNILFYTFLRFKMLIRLNIIYFIVTSIQLLMYYAIIIYLTATYQH